MSPEGQWHLAPAYDLTFIIATNGIEPEKAHCMSIGGKYSDITTEDLIRLGRDNSVKNPEEVINCVLKGTEKGNIHFLATIDGREENDPG